MASEYWRGVKMKNLLWVFVLALLLSPGLGFSQTTVTGGPTPGLAQPDCNLPFSFTVAGSSTSFDNRTIGCASWHVMYYANGCTVTSIQPQFAADVAGSPGSFAVFPAAQVFGTVPLTSNTESQVTFSGFHPWVNVRLITATNCTLVSGRLIGWKPQGSSESTAAATPSQGVAGEGTPASGFPQQIGGKFETTPVTLTDQQQGVLQQDAKGNLLTVISPSALSADGITPITSTTVESSHILKASAGNFYGACVTTGAVAGFMMVFNLTSAPADGAVTPVEWIQLAANSTACLSYGSGPPNAYATGITLVYSSTGPFTKTASATAAFVGRVK